MAAASSFRKRPRLFSWRVKGLLVLLVFMVWGVGLISFANQIARTTPEEGMAEGLVVLTGGSQRIEVAAALLSEMPQSRMLVTGVNRSVDRETLLARLGGLSDAEKARVDLGYAAEDTIGNAIETAGWAVANGYTRLRIVTAAYHMPRSLAEYHHAMPKATLLSHPVFPEHVEFQRWWRAPGTAALMASEWTKYLFASLRIMALEWLHQPDKGTP